MVEPLISLLDQRVVQCTIYNLQFTMYNVHTFRSLSTHTKLGCGQYKVENLCVCLFIIDQLQSCEMTNNYFQHLNLILVLVHQPQQERGIFGLCRGTEAAKYATTTASATATASNSPEN